MKVLLVDGYNVLRSSGLYSHLRDVSPDYTHDAFNLARQTLISDVATFAGREYEATIVFDGGENPQSTGEPQAVAGLQVIFSPWGTSADSVIERHARTAVERGKTVVVVTSDAATQWTVLGDRVIRMSAVGFAEEMRAVRQELTEAAEQQIAKQTLAQRLDPATREQLERIARSQ
jgi:predicted RNA-binding protein with PIN domain